MPRKPKLDLTELASVLLREAVDAPGSLPELLDAAIDQGSLACIDWREETAGIINGADRMLARLGSSVDWSFIDHLIDMDQGEVLRNRNVLSHLRDQLLQIGLRLAHIDVGDDAYRFAVLAPSDFERLNGMARKNVVTISDDFCPDEFYSPARVHLTTVGFVQPTRTIDPAQQASKQRARRIKSLRKLLDDESTFDPGESADSLVKPYAQWKLPTDGSEMAPWQVAGKIQMMTTWMERRASRRLLMGDAATAGTLRDCWRLRLLERAFVERDCLERMTKFPNLAAAAKEGSFFDARRYLHLTVAAAALSYFGFEKEFRQCASFYPLFEARLDRLGSHRIEQEEQLLALMRFLSTERPTSADLDALAAITPFEVLRGTWEKNGHFAQALAELADWHLAKCHVALSGSDDIHDIHVPGYDFFPTWLLAIDRHRERVLGNSSLPSHDLFDLARPYIDANYDVPEGKLVQEVRALYERSWNDSPDWIEAWKPYLTGDDD
jgi:hypothetical protein